MREDLPKDLRTQASNLVWTAGKHIGELLIEAANEIEKLRSDLQNQEKEHEKILEKACEEAYQLILMERAKLKPQAEWKNDDAEEVKKNDSSLKVSIQFNFEN